MVLYLISGRGFYASSLGRKISEVCNVFNSVTDMEVLCGGDIPLKNKESAMRPSITNAEYHAKWYRRNNFVRGLAESYGELKSMYHSLQTYRYIGDNYSHAELIWERSSNMHWAGILYAKKHNIPSVLEWKDHLIKDHWSFLKPLAQYIERWKNKNATYIAVESEVLKNDLIKEGVDAEKIYVTYNAVNPKEFKKDENLSKEVRSELGFSSDDIIVGYVGSYAFYHDSIRMVKAAKILRDSKATNIKWLLIGDGKDKATCEHYAHDNGLLGDGTIKMLPFQAKENIPRYLSAMDATILPGSTDIICPIKVMEYMAATSVVLVPDYECNREIINESNGLLFKPGSEQSIADALIQLSADRAFCKRLGEAARKTVIEKLTWDKTYGAVLKNILLKIKE